MCRPFFFDEKTTVVHEEHLLWHGTSKVAAEAIVACLKKAGNWFQFQKLMAEDQRKIQSEVFFF